MEMGRSNTVDVRRGRAGAISVFAFQLNVFVDHAATGDTIQKA
jgi:hypothetical protein